jgi:adenylyltransferase/sulfurtransferase
MNRFELSTEPLDTAQLKNGLRHARAGGFASFEGWVRNHNEGRDVGRLEYEAFAAVAEKEGTRVVIEAVERFGVTAAHCVHRVGDLRIGDLAVWVGVSAEHRGEAFVACRYIIDQIKARVPIWKKEHYSDGVTGWVNCERVSGPEPPQPALPATTDGLYARQIALKEIGENGQQLLSEARVLVVGAGGLGSPALMYLAAAGVGHIGICEGDTLEASNLHRQVLYRRSHVGQSKAHIAAQQLRELNPDTEITVIDVSLDADNAESLFNQHDLVLDCSDNLKLKFLLNAAALRTATPVVFASVYQYEGQLHVFDPRTGAPCLRCVWPREPSVAPTCNEAGVLGPVPGVFGSLQAMEALKQLLSLPGRLSGELLMLDLLSFRSTKISASRLADCEICSRAPDQIELPRPGEFEIALDMDLAEVDPGLRNDYVVIDIREQDEVSARPLTTLPHRHIAMSAFSLDAPPIEPDQPYLLCCASGTRSRSLAIELRQRGFAQVYSQTGGVDHLDHGQARGGD